VGIDTMKRLLEIAKRYRPAKTKVRFRRDKEIMPAHAAIWADGTREIYSPRILCRESLFIYLHECAHLHLGHCRPDSKMPIWKQEYEAELWAISTMRMEGLAVPRRIMKWARQYVKDCIKEDIKKRGLPMPPAKVLRWCRW